MWTNPITTKAPKNTSSICSSLRVSLASWLFSAKCYIPCIVHLVDYVAKGFRLSARYSLFTDFVDGWGLVPVVSDALLLTSLFLLLGYLGMPGAQGAVAFFRTRLAPADRLYPDIQMQMVCSLVAGVFRKNWNLKGEVEGQVDRLVAVQTYHWEVEGQVHGLATVQSLPLGGRGPSTWTCYSTELTTGR